MTDRHLWPKFTTEIYQLLSYFLLCPDLSGSLSGITTPSKAASVCCEERMLRIWSCNRIPMAFKESGSPLIKGVILSRSTDIVTVGSWFSLSSLSYLICNQAALWTLSTKLVHIAHNGNWITQLKRTQSSSPRDYLLSYRPWAALVTGIRKTPGPQETSASASWMSMR